ncbi:LytR/AlgR family response regulator transcription factor [Pseudomarimonas salicorniae]|uniref:LytTR family DNA-binding domain-containing protein n=1 Tax=Pseudomarimonas salicorniae TaxID=2933270 RepID=A0ABT0GHC5_9GAMM|nr:LytTR family DNA-binding domain-containing protein [Lysobacter sp. CAU 1642]MCK7593943.1 LytTR family DNA-binding domain-containing protein [Lysobacter sp. CAU 1642]
MRILIVDDEPLARQRLRDLLGQVEGAEVVAEASNGREGCEQAAALKPDLVLLDIAMPVMDGLEAAAHLASTSHAPAVVFCTAYDEHALAAFEAGAIDYLLKPVRVERLREALGRARRIGPPGLAAIDEAAGEERQRTHLCARLRGSMRLIPIEEIRYLQADEKYVVIHHAHGEDLIEDSLKSLESEFGDRFLRIHRNCLVAADEIMELRRGADGHTRARLRNTSELLDVSRRCLPGLRKKVLEL